MTLEEILKEIAGLSRVDKRELFSGKNDKLAEKDVSISDLNKKLSEANAELKGFKDKEIEITHKGLVDSHFDSLGTVKDEYRDTIATLANIDINDNKNTIKNKVDVIAKQDKYSSFFSERQTIDKTFQPSTHDIGDNKKDGTSEAKLLHL